MAEGAQNPHLGRRELVCLGQEKLLEPEGVSGEQWGEPGGAGCTGRGWRLSQPRWSAPPKSREDPKRQVATLTRGPTSLPASGTVPPVIYSVVPLTHPCSPRLCHWGQRGGRRSGWLLQGLSLGGQDSQVSTHTPASQPHRGGTRGAGGNLPHHREGGGYPIQSAPWGSEKLGSAIFLKWRAWPGGWDWGFGSESEGIFSSPEAWGDRCSWNAEVGPTSSGWARARWGLDRLWVGFRLGPGRVQVECTLAAQPGTPDLPGAHH